MTFKTEIQTFDDTQEREVGWRRSLDVSRIYMLTETLGVANTQGEYIE